ncbi:Encoded by [Rhizoctonia solani]|uniref:Encoded by n=1 Tax=Rhizoctonia solani TaxID=456999 RepID=A0A8H7LEW9_9AGAM|nr:Encoded by [Rhizoctonia solani]
MQQSVGNPATQPKPARTNLEAPNLLPLESNNVLITPTETTPSAVPNASNSNLKRKKTHKIDPNSSEIVSRCQAVESRIAALEAVLDAAESVPPTLTPPASSNSADARYLWSAARDVWYFVTPVESKDSVSEDEINAQIEADTSQQSSIPFASVCRPQLPYLQCRPCLSGSTVQCREEGIQHIHGPKIAPNTPPEFTRAGLVKRLVDWIAIDNQALNVVENPEFRELLLYCGQSAFKNSDVPHCDKLATAAWATYLIKKEKINADMKCARGRISLTSDLWTNVNLCLFMLKVDGHHTGANVGQVLFSVLLESGISNKIGCITLDNASNNNTLMQELAQAFESRGIEFDEKENWIRCFPHVMNLAVNAILKSLPEAGTGFWRVLQGSEQPIDDATSEYLTALDSSPVEACCASVLACCSSGIRRKGIRQIILDGNVTGRFRLPNGESYNVPAITEYAFRNRPAQIPIVLHRQYEVLQDILSVLGVAHNAQELLSAEKTPTLSLAFPVYELVIEAWELLRERIPELQCPITAGINKICECVGRTQEATIHTLAMVVNPSLKFEWINQHWSPFHREQAYKAVKAKMLAFQRESFERTLEERRFQPSSATQAQNRGYLRVLTSGQNFRRASNPAESSEPSMPETLTMEDEARLDESTHDTLPAITRGRLAPSLADIRAHNNGAVEFELNRYISAGTIPIEAMGAIVLTEYWRANRFTYPLLYRIAMDVLPVQASSVSSERVFSSSKLTCTSERNRISSRSMESLQVLKHALYRRRRSAAESQVLDFVAHQFENLEVDD